MTMQFHDLAQRAAADGVIAPEEILALRRAGWSDGRILPEEADAIFLLNDQLGEPTPEWSDFFVEALGEFIVNHVEPKGYVSEAQADWLMAKICHDGRTDSLTELELLVGVFERASSVPERLRHYALEQIERAVLTGVGPTRSGGRLESGNVTEAEASLMRRIIFSSGSERPAAVSRAEAELLYRIKDAALGADNSPEWKRLFVQGVGNFLMGFAQHTPLTRERAAELESFMSDSHVSIGGFFGRMGKATVSGGVFAAIGNALGRGAGEDRSIASRVQEAEEVTADEQAWLQAELDRNVQVDEYDRALLDFLAGERGRAD